MYFCYGYSIDIYLDWFPKYLNEHRGFNLTQMGIYASLPLLAGAAGDLFGGTVSDLCARRFGNLKLARRSVALWPDSFSLQFLFFLPLSRIIPPLRFSIRVSRSSDWKSQSACPGRFHSTSEATMQDRSPQL